MSTDLTLSFLGGCLLSLTAGPMGAFLVWGRMAFLADALAHASLLGSVVVSLTLIPLKLAFVMFVVFSAVILWFLISFFKNKEDVMLLLFSGGFMGAGLLLMSFVGMSSDELIGYLTGRGTQPDLFLWMMLMAVVVGSVIFFFFAWRSLLATVISPDIAQVEGVPVKVLKFIFMLLVFFFVFLGIRWSGALFVTMLLVCPFLIAKPWFSDPGKTLLASSLVGFVCFVPSFWANLAYHLPQGPFLSFLMIVVIVLSHGLAAYVERLKRSSVKKGAS